jgi:exodeoxyribonuclease VII small subunit
MSNYKSLEKAAQELTEMTEPDVDRIMPLVMEGMSAYKVCKARIDAVRKELEGLNE